MLSNSASRAFVAANENKLTQLSHLCVLVGALNETCKARGNSKYSSSNINSDTSLTKFQIFLNKLAQICDSQKGGATMTAMVCSKKPRALNTSSAPTPEKNRA